METIEIKAASVEEAIQKGLETLGKKQDEVDIEIVEIGGFLKKAKVILTEKATEGTKAVNFVKELLKKMNIDLTAELSEDDEKAVINLSGKDSGKVIGYRGDVLDAVQYLTSVAVNAGSDSFKKIVIDCENYRTKREETLISLAGKLADKACERGRKVSLEPMNPFERRIIHAALQENQNVTTESEGTEPNRFVVIKPKNYSRGGYEKRENRGGYEKRENRGGYEKRDNRGGYEKREGASKSGGAQRPRKSSSGGFGTYLGNSKSGFGFDNTFTKKSGFDNLKD